MISRIQKISKRGRAAALAAIFSIISKGLYFALTLYAFAVTFGYLGPQRFGIFATILGFGAILSILDLGIGNVLIGSIARLKAENDHKGIAIEIKVGLILLSCLGLLLLALLTLGIHFFSIEGIFKNLDPSLWAEARLGLMIFACGFALTLPLQGVQRITQGLQKAYYTHISSSVFIILAFIALYIASANEASIPTLIGICFILPALAPIVLLPWVLKFARSAHIEPPHFLSSAKYFLRSGSVFFLLQAGAIAGWGIDGFLASSQIGSESAGLYSVVQRLFQFVTFPLMILNAPLWPAYAHASSSGDASFIQSTLQKSFFYTLIAATLITILISVFSSQILMVWLHRDVLIPIMLLLAYGAWAIVEAGGNAYAMFLNGLNLMRIQLLTNIGFIAIAIPLKYLLIDKIGLVGLPMGTLIAYFLAIFLPYALFLKPHSDWNLKK